MEAPNIRSHDAAAFKRIALTVRALVAMLYKLGEEGHIELKYGSHVTRVMSKLPQERCADFMEYIHPFNVRVLTLFDFSDWLEFELKVQEYGQCLLREVKETTEGKRERRKD